MENCQLIGEFTPPSAIIKGLSSQLLLQTNPTRTVLSQRGFSYDPAVPWILFGEH